MEEKRSRIPGALAIGAIVAVAWIVLTLSSAFAG